jgi:hypothetical protein
MRAASFVDRNLGQPRALNEFLAENPHFQTTDVGSYSVFGRLAGHIFSFKRVCMTVLAALMLSSFAVQPSKDYEETEERLHERLAVRFVPT